MARYNLKSCVCARGVWGAGEDPPVTRGERGNGTAFSVAEGAAGPRTERGSEATPATAPGPGPCRCRIPPRPRPKGAQPRSDRPGQAPEAVFGPGRPAGAG